MKKSILIIIGLLLIISIVFVLWPSPINAIAFTPESAPGYVGVYAKNNDLEGLEKIYTGHCNSCEDVAIDKEGTIYGSQVTGEIVALEKDTSYVIAHTNGRPLGLDFDQWGNLIIADADKGLLMLDTLMKLTTLSTSSEDIDFKFVDDVDVGPDGMIYFSDASYKYGFHETMKDIMEHGGYGRLLVYNPFTEQTKTLLNGLQFANGVATSPDSSFVLINETGSHSMRKYWLRGPNKDTEETLMTNLPGYPDGVSRGSDGIYWLTLVNPRSAELDAMMPKPWLRDLIMKLPSSVLAAVPEHYSFIIGLDEYGKVKYNLQDSEPNLKEITSVEEYNGALYFGTLSDDGIGRLELNKIFNYKR